VVKQSNRIMLLLILTDLSSTSAKLSCCLPNPLKYNSRIVVRRKRLFYLFMDNDILTIKF